MAILDSLSVVFPMFNEKDYIRKTVAMTINTLKEITEDYEIIIVDDASTDGSAWIADELARCHPCIRVIHHKKNRKLGGALKTGFLAATKEIIIYTDIDMPFDLLLLKEIVPLSREFDIINGYRIGNRESLLRVIYSKGYNFLVNFLFNLKIRDVNFAMKIFRKGMLDSIELKSEGSFINVEFLAKARRLGCSVKEVEVEYKLRTYGISRLSSPAVILKILFEMIKFSPEIKLFSRKKALYSRVKKFYKKISFKTRIYNFIRFKSCPFNKIIEFIPNEGAVLDLGCGTGILINLLRLGSRNHSLVGLDRDARKINVALGTLSGSEDIKFIQRDITDSYSDLSKMKCVTLIDILCYLTHIQTKELLKKIFDILDSDGTLIVKDLNKALSLKFLWTFLHEFLTVRIFRLTYANGLYFKMESDYLSLLEESGFTVNIFDLSKGYFYPHVLYVCSKD